MKVRFSPDSGYMASVTSVGYVPIAFSPENDRLQDKTRRGIGQPSSFGMARRVGAVEIAGRIALYPAGTNS
jgi:hypothetical protein